MSVWRTVKNVASLGGAERLERAEARYLKALEAYQEIKAKLDRAQSRVEELKQDIWISGRKAKTDLTKAYSLLKPLQFSDASARGGAPNYDTHSHEEPSMVRRSSLGAFEHLSTGAAAGLLTTITAWQGIQLLGTASTGTAIYGLHGIAASNAGWAALGGGSLASGGGGMALGHLVLPGVGLAVAVGYATIATHSAANKRNHYADELESANPKNRVALHTADRVEAALFQAMEVFERKREALHSALICANRDLRRFGVISTSYRWCRWWLGGEYYKPKEMTAVVRLQDAVVSFMDGLGSSTAQTSYRNYSSWLRLNSTSGRRVSLEPTLATIIFAVICATLVALVKVNHPYGQSAPVSFQQTQIENVEPSPEAAKIAHQSTNVMNQAKAERTVSADRSSLNYGSSADSNQAELMEAIDHWRLALLSNDPQMQAEPYAATMERYFLQSGWTNLQVQSYLQKLHADGGFTTLAIRDVVIDSQTELAAEVHFIKDFSIERNGKLTSNVVRSVLHFVREKGKWKTNYERDFKMQT